MAYNDIIDRSSPGGGALVPPEHSNAIIKEAENQSAALGLMRRMPILTDSKSFPVMSGLPMAYWLDPTANPQDDTALIQTTDMAWKNVTMNVAEVGVIVPFPRRLASDIAAGGINLTEEMRPSLAAALARTIDAAIFFGTNKPVVWPSAVVAAVTAAGNTVTMSKTAAQGGLHSDIISLFRKVREDGFVPTAGIARTTFEFDLMDARDTTGQPLLKTSDASLALGARANVLGRPVTFATDGVFPASTTGADPELILFDAQKHIIGVREEMFMTIHTEGVIQNASGVIQYNLMQQDIMAIRMLARIGYAVANPVTVAQPNEANRYPGGVLLSPADSAD